MNVFVQCSCLDVGRQENGGINMEYSAIAHEADKRYCYALEQGTFLFRIQVKREDIECITIHYQDKYIPISFMDRELLSRCIWHQVTDIMIFLK